MSLADIHFEKYDVQPDFIVESDASTEGTKDAEVEEESCMEEEPIPPPPNPIIIADNHDWKPTVEKEVRIGAVKSTK